MSKLLQYSSLYRLVVFVVLSVASHSALSQATIRVPQDRSTIQAGIDAASNGDTVLVSPGRYDENIDFRGKNITVTSGATSYSAAANTVIQAPTASPVVVLDSGETLGAVLNGFTITHASINSGFKTQDGIAVENASATLTNNDLSGNQGCGIVAVNAPSLTATGNHFTGLNTLHSNYCGLTTVNSADPAYLGGISIVDSGDARIVGNVFEGNVTDGVAGVTASFSDSLLIQNNIIRNNNSLGSIGAFDVHMIQILQNLVASPTNGEVIEIDHVHNMPYPMTLVVADNTLYFGPYYTQGLVLAAPLVSATVSNNIFVTPPDAPAVQCFPQIANSPILIDHNDLLPVGNPPASSTCVSNGSYTGNLSVDPQFVNFTGGDGHLQRSSPLLAAGNPAAPNILATDLDGKNRTVCGTIDMGAYEVHPQPLIALSSAPNPSVGGSAVTFTFSLAGNCNIPTGLVTLLDGSNAIGTVTLDPNGSGAFTTTALTVGTHGISATYPGDFNFENSTSNTVQQVVTGYPSTTSLQMLPNPAGAFQSITFTSAVASQFGVPTGTVSFYAGSNLLATAPVNGAGTASVNLNTLGVGTYSITAVYNASIYFAGSTSPVVIETVVGAATATTLASAPNPSGFGQGVIFTSIVRAPQSSVTPVGTVNFREGTTVLGSALLNSAGVASFATSLLTVGSHVVFADYTGSSSDNASTSTSAVQVVQPLSAVIALSGTPNPAALGQTVTLVANATPVGNSAVPAGSITFADQYGTLGTSPLVGGQAVFTISSLTTGTHNTTATFSATGNFAGAVSPVLAEIIQSFDFSITLNPTQLSLAAGKQGQITVRFAGVGNLPGSVALQASQIPMYATLGFSPQTVSFAAGGSGSSLLSIDTAQATHHALLESPGKKRDRLMLAFAGLFVTPLLFLRRRRFIQRLVLAVPMACLLALSGCTNIYYPLNRVEPGTYVIPITATDATTGITHTATLTLTVTP